MAITNEFLFSPDDPTWLKAVSKMDELIAARLKELEQERDPIVAAELRGQIRAARTLKGIPNQTRVK